MCLLIDSSCGINKTENRIGLNTHTTQKPNQCEHSLQKFALNAFVLKICSKHLLWDMIKLSRYRCYPLICVKFLTLADLVSRAKSASEMTSNEMTNIVNTTSSNMFKAGWLDNSVKTSLLTIILDGV